MNDKRKPVFEVLAKLNIEYELDDHPAVYTIEEMDNLGMNDKGEVLKNLFLRDDKKRNFYLIVMCKQKRADLKELKTKLESRQLMFASEESLYEYLKLEKGAVTPLGIVNDTERKVEVIFDCDVFNFDIVGVHPNDNTATVWLNPDDLRKVAVENGNAIREIQV